LHQRLQCIDNYFFKIKFVFFLYLLLSWYISDIRQIVGYRTPVFIQPFPWHLHITITYNLPHLQLQCMICWRCHSYSVNTGSRLPYLSDVKTRKRRNAVGIDMIRNNRIVRLYYTMSTCNRIQYVFFFKFINNLNLKIFHLL